MALIGTAMANGGLAANGARVFSEETVKKVQKCENISFLIIIYLFTTLSFKQNRHKGTL